METKTKTCGPIPGGLILTHTQINGVLCATWLICFRLRFARFVAFGFVAFSEAAVREADIVILGVPSAARRVAPHEAPVV